MKRSGHHAVVLGEETQVLDINLLQKRVDVDLLDSGSNLLVQFLVVRLELGITLLVAIVLLLESLEFSCKALFLGGELGVFDLKLNGFIAGPVSQCLPLL